MLETIILAFSSFIPLFGKTIGYSESIVFYGLPLILAVQLFNQKNNPKQLPPIWVNFQVILLALFLLSTIFSKNIGLSYYKLFQFANCLFVVNIMFFAIKQPSRFYKFLIFSSTILSFVLLLDHFRIINLPTKTLSDNFIKQIWGHSYLSEFLIITIPLSYRYLKNHFKQWLAFALINIPTLYLTNSRTAIIILILTTVLFALTSTIQLKIKITLSAIILMSVVFLSNIFIQTKTNQSLYKTPDGSRPTYWLQAWQFFKESPVLGNGPGTFIIANNKFSTPTSPATTLAHSSLLGYLSENGLIFSLCLAYLTTHFLIKKYRQDKFIFFACLASVLTSIFDTSWNNNGVFIITFYLLLDHSKTAAYPKTNLAKILALIIGLFFVSKTSSDILTLSGHPKYGLILDPFNLNARFALISTETNPSTRENLINQTINLFKNDETTYLQLIKIIPLPQSENYYYQLMKLKPVTSQYTYFQLLHAYTQISDNSKFEQILNQILQSNYPTNNNDSALLSALLYQQALLQWQNQNTLNLKYLQNASQFAPDWSHIQIELANVYWLNNQKDLAEKVLSNCLNRTVPRQHCQEYIDQKQFGQFGIFKNDITKILPALSPR